MSNNTTPSELTLILQTIVKPNYANSNVDNYYVASTLVPTVPTTGTPDRIMQYITELILYLKNPAVFGYNAAMSDGDLLDLYQDLQRNLGDTVTQLTIIKTEIDDKVDELGV